MSSDQQSRIPDMRPSLAFGFATLAGFLSGYFASGALEAKQKGEEIQAVSYPEPTGTHFPDTFDTRSDAVAWLKTQIEFLDRHCTESQRPVVDLFKSRFEAVTARPTVRIERSLFSYVREEVELLRSDLADGRVAESPRRYNPVRRGWRDD